MPTYCPDEKKKRRRPFSFGARFWDGNYKDSKMEKLADKGNGNYAYMDNINEAKEN